MERYLNNNIMIHIGDTRKALVNGIKTVVVRQIINKNCVKVSLGFDTKGNDVTVIINTWDILPKQ